MPDHGRHADAAPRTREKKSTRAPSPAGETVRKPVPRHKHWSARAADYQRLAREARSAEVRGVIDHLAQVCAEMATATAPVPTNRTADRWLEPNDVVREATAQRWRIREAEYLALADNAASDEGRQGWLTIAKRCAELADYLDGT